MLNQVILAGRLTADPDLKCTKNRKFIANFSLAVSGDKKGMQTDFFAVACYQQTAEYVNRYYHKGDYVIIKGRLAQRRWNDKKTGGQRSIVEIICDSIYPCGLTFKNAEVDRFNNLATADDYESIDEETIPV